MKIRNIYCLILCSIVIVSCGANGSGHMGSSDWSVRVLPSSVRLNPVSNTIVDRKAAVYPSQKKMPQNLLEQNWIYDGDSVSLHGARGEYISFQVVLSNQSDSTLRDIAVHVDPFRNGSMQFKNDPELFLEWSVRVETPSTGYPKASLGKGWYPDALIPFRFIQQDSSKVKRRWTYPLWLPDFNNRIPNQKSLIIWVDQYIPFNRNKAKPGIYTTNVSVKVGKKTARIPVQLKVWDFALPNENTFEASLQQSGFLSGMDEKEELETYQLFKRNRVGLMDPTYTPNLSISKSGSVHINWQSFDARLKKYLTGKAFTKEHGYTFGPGYGEPVETFILPFDVYGKYGTTGWPDIGKPGVEQNPQNKATYIDAIKKVRTHLQGMVNPKKTDLIVYLNGLDESYFPEAWERMVYYGDLFHKYYPEINFRVDGGYSKKAMKVIHKSIDYWAAHTINYNMDKVKKYRKMGIKDWLYGPMIYESKVNSWVGSSTFIDLPLVNDRAISWSCWKYGTYSWISWGIGAGWKRGWYDPESWKDAYKKGADSDSTFTYKKLNGNALLAYSPDIIPNVSGVSPSIRLKMMRDGIQEYEYLKKISTLDGNTSRADSTVNSIINQPFGKRAIGNLDVWNYDAKKWYKARIKLGKMINNEIK